MAAAMAVFQTATK